MTARIAHARAAHARAAHARTGHARSAHRVTGALMSQSLVVFGLFLLGLFLLGVLQPVSAQVDPEVGQNDFQLSFSQSSPIPTVAYSPNRQEYLVAWWEDAYSDLVLQRVDTLGVAIGDPIVTGLGGFEAEIEVSHDPVNDRFLVTADQPSMISGVLVDSNGQSFAPFPITGSGSEYDVVFNPDVQEYTVVKSGTFDMYIRRVTANGQVIGLEDTHIQNVDGGRSVRAVYNTAEHEYLVAWQSDFRQTWVRRFDEDWQAVAADHRISGTHDAYNPDLAYNPDQNEYLVVWTREEWDTTVDGDEIFGQRLDSQGGEIGIDDFQISTMGRPGRTESDARNARIRFNSLRDRYLVVWSGDDYSGDMVNDEFEIFGQYLSHSGGLLQPGNFRISKLGAVGDATVDAYGPRLSYSPEVDEFLVIFAGGQISQLRIYGQRIYGAPTIFSDGFETGNDQQWSSASP